MIKSTIEMGRYVPYNKEEEIRLSQELKQKKKTLHDEIKICYNCSNKIKSYHVSHSLPQSILTNLKTIKNEKYDGDVGTYNVATDIFLVKKEAGAKQAGVFHLICSECDIELFKKYENSKCLVDEATSEMKNQIMIKNYLFKIYHNRQTVKICDDILNNPRNNLRVSPEINLKNQKALAMRAIAELDLKRYHDDFLACKTNIIKKFAEEPYLFYAKKLDYTVPIGFHHSFAVPYDFESEVIYDVFNGNPNSADLHICVFPREGYSEIMLLIENSKRANKYRAFRKQFHKLEDDDKLQAILFLIFRYSDQYYYAKYIYEIIEKDIMIKELACETNYWISSLDKKEQEAYRKSTCNLNKRDKIPKLLSKEYSIEMMSLKNE